MQINHVAHTGITVSDLDRSVAFYRDVIGCKVVRRVTCEGPIYEQITGVKGAAFRIANMQAPGGHAIELLEYSAPDGRKTVDAPPSHVGAMHIAFLVEDIDAVIDMVSKAGLKPVSAVVPTIDRGGLTGLRAIYTHDPDGIVIEFLEYTTLRSADATAELEAAAAPSQ